MIVLSSNYSVSHAPWLLVLLPVPGTAVGMGILTDTSFKSLEEKVCEPTLKAVADMGFTHMTEIQAKAVPHLLEGRFVSNVK